MFSLQFERSMTSGCNLKGLWPRVAIWKVSDLGLQWNLDEKIRVCFKNSFFLNCDCIKKIMPAVEGTNSNPNYKDGTKLPEYLACIYNINVQYPRIWKSEYKIDPNGNPAVYTV